LDGAHEDVKLYKGAKKIVGAAEAFLAESCGSGLAGAPVAAAAGGAATSSSSTSSTSLEGPAPPADAEADAAVKGKGKGKGKAKQMLDVWPIHDEVGTYIGFIKVDRLREQFNAHCCQLGPPGAHDHRTATTRECRINRMATKKPLGYLIQWLRQANAYDCRDDHRDSGLLISRAEQVTCRDWLRGQEALQPLLQHEAAWNGLAWRGVDTVTEDM
jgi:hypothetical protein